MIRTLVDSDISETILPSSIWMISPTRIQWNAIRVFFSTAHFVVVAKLAGTGLLLPCQAQRPGAASGCLGGWEFIESKEGGTLNHQNGEHEKP